MQKQQHRFFSGILLRPTNGSTSTSLSFSIPRIFYVTTESGSLGSASGSNGGHSRQRRRSKRGEKGEMNGRSASRCGPKISPSTAEFLAQIDKASCDEHVHTAFLVCKTKIVSPGWDQVGVACVSRVEYPKKSSPNVGIFVALRPHSQA